MVRSAAPVATWPINEILTKSLRVHMQSLQTPYAYSALITNGSEFGGLGMKPPPPPANNAAAPPDLFTAFQEQLGLKLESTKAQAEVFVIDKVAKQTEN